MTAKSRWKQTRLWLQSPDETVVQGLVILALVLLLWYFIGTPLHFPASVAGAGLLGLLLLSAIVLGITGGVGERWTHHQTLIVVAVALCLPLYSAIRAKLYFGQPFIYGVLAERHWWGIASGPVIFYLLASARITPGGLLKSLLTLSWLSLIGFTAIACLYVFDGELGMELFEMTAISNFESRGLRVKFPLYAIVFGAFYYLALASRENAPANIMRAGLFIAYIVFISRGRLDIACLGLALLYVLYASRLYRRWQAGLAAVCLYGLLAFLVPQLAALSGFSGSVPDEAKDVATLSEKAKAKTLVGQTTKDLQKLMAGEHAVVDQGLKARSYSLRIVRERLSDSTTLLLMGSGRVSNHWQRGFTGAMGTWFYPPELGFIGAIFVYGLIFYMAFVAYSLFLARRVFQQAAATDPVVTTTFRWMLVYLLVQFVAGMPLLYPTQFYFTVFACLGLAALARRTQQSG